MSMSSLSSCIEYIKKELSPSEILCQLAEESAELSKAALKLRRVLDKKNPTPVTLEEALNNVDEEVADVMVCLAMLDISVSTSHYTDTIYFKIRRWADRIAEARAKEAAKNG